MIPKFVQSVLHGETNFGIGTLELVPAELTQAPPFHLSPKAARKRRELKITTMTSERSVGVTTLEHFPFWWNWDVL